jgi:NADPH-dependent 2,4-dienoyl-CoA reductase/sulfur reductase-like enzyme
VYGNEDSLGGNVVVIGGGETGVETGMHLAENGHRVTVIEMGEMLVPKATPAHYYIVFKESWEKLANFSSIINARVTGIADNNVIYAGTDGRENSVPADSVVIAAGYKPKNDRAMEFAIPGVRFFIIGDCNKVGNVQTVVRSAYSSACML